MFVNINIDLGVIRTLLVSKHLKPRCMHMGGTRPREAIYDATFQVNSSSRFTGMLIIAVGWTFTNY